MKVGSLYLLIVRLKVEAKVLVVVVDVRRLRRFLLVMIVIIATSIVAI